MDSYEERANKLRRLFDEISTDGDTDNENCDIETSESESDVFSDDGEFNDDPEYLPSENMSTSDSDIECEEYPRTFDRNNAMEVCETHEEWHENTDIILDFPFDSENVGVKLGINEKSSPRDIFDKIFDKDIVDRLVTSTNLYGKKLCEDNKSKTRNCRNTKFTEINNFERTCV